MQDVKIEKHIYTVSELTRHIKVILEDNFPLIWVEGEVSNFTKHSSGHMYFSLKDKSSVINCVMFKRSNYNLKFEVEGGMQVVAFGRISLYDKRGQYQLYVENIEPKGIGALQLAFEQLKKKLDREGLFDVAIKKPIPYLPSKIGVVTSPTGAAIKDILNVTKRRFQSIDLVINPVRVQGKDAAPEIREAIEDFNKFKKVDVIIVTRGGGSLEDLWAFNEEIVARAIHQSKIPIISAVGHEIDWTIADFVSDFRAPTPSAAAELVIPRKEDLEKRIGELAERLYQFPKEILQQYEQELDDLLKGLSIGVGRITDVASNRFQNLCSRLEALSPLAVLKRGYSITTKLSDGKALKDIRFLERGDRIRTRLARGEFISKVERTELTEGRDNA